jgi:hypothetical protein
MTQRRQAAPTVTLGDERIAAEEYADLGGSVESEQFASMLARVISSYVRREGT